jgi:hypothetical protein
MSLAVPTPGLIAGMRHNAGLTQQQAAEMVHLGSFKRWSEYERGLMPMDPAHWELFRIKCGKHELYKPVKSVPVPKAGDMAKAAPVRSVEAVVKAVTDAPKRHAGSGRPGPSNRP